MRKPADIALAFPGLRTGLALAAASLVGLLFLSVTALYGGALLIRDPSGEALAMPTAWLEGTPFPDYLLPGVVLFVANGLFPALAAGSVLYRARRAPALVAASGVLLCGWLAIQGVLVGYGHPIQTLYLGLGVALMALGTAWEVVAARQPQ